MTKRIVAVLALSLASTSAFASQAHNIVSGGGDADRILCANGMCGSFYTNDEYNIFWNPALINGQKGYAVIENQNTSGTSAGFVTDVANFNLGVFLNRPLNTFGADRAVDVVLGGETGVKWGVGLTHALSEGAPKFTKLNAGVVVSDFEPFVSYTIKNTDGATSESKATDMTIGTRYHYGEWTPYAAYRTSKATAAGVEASESGSAYGLGLGRMTKMGEVKMDYAVSYWHTGGANPKTSVVPVEMSASVDASSWLVVRAGFSHDLIARGITPATSTRLGGTFKMGKADLDMVVKKDGTTGEFGFSDDLVANAGLTYRW